MHIRNFFLTIIAVTCFTLPAAAQSATQGHWLFRVRALAIMPQMSGTATVGGISVPGKIEVPNTGTPEIDFTYFFNDHWAAELVIGTTRHSVSQTTIGNIGTVWLIPPILTVQYHFDGIGPIHPYVGAGVNYTIFYNVKSPIPGLYYNNSFGAVLQAGMDVPIGKTNFSFNTDVKKLFLSTSAAAVGGALKLNNVRLDPWLLSVGVGYRF